MDTSIPQSVDLKQCTKCKRYLPRTNKHFSNHARSKDGMNCWCKDCYKKPSIATQRFPPTTLVCMTCNKEFKRRVSTQKYLTEKRGIKDIYCSSACRSEAQTVPLPDSVAQDYEQGMSCSEIAKLHQVSSGHVRNKLIKMHVKLRTQSELMLHTSKNPTKGKGHTPEAIEKIRAANQKQFSNPDNRELAAHNQRKVMSEGRMPSSSKLEDRVAQVLSDMGYAFIRQYSIRDPQTCRFIACVDFYLSDGRAIEVNGTYWHSDARVYPNEENLHPLQKRSLANYRKKMTHLARLNVPVVEMWELDLKRDFTGTISKALSS